MVENMYSLALLRFPISRDPPEGGTSWSSPSHRGRRIDVFQFLGIPPKGELKHGYLGLIYIRLFSNF